MFKLFTGAKEEPHGVEYAMEDEVEDVPHDPGCDPYDSVEDVLKAPEGVVVDPLGTQHDLAGHVGSNDIGLPLNW